MVNKVIKERYLNGFYLEVELFVSDVKSELFKNKEIDKALAITPLTPANLIVFNWIVQAMYEADRIREMYPEGKIEVNRETNTITGIDVSDDCAIEIAMANKKLKSDEFLEELIEKRNIKFDSLDNIVG